MERSKEMDAGEIQNYGKDNTSPALIINIASERLSLWKMHGRMCAGLESVFYSLCSYPAIKDSGFYRTSVIGQKCQEKKNALINFFMKNHLLFIWKQLNSCRYRHLTMGKVKVNSTYAYRAVEKYYIINKENICLYLYRKQTQCVYTCIISYVHSKGKPAGDGIHFKNPWKLLHTI